MTGALPPGGRTPGTRGEATPHSSNLPDAGDLRPPEVGPDGVFGLITLDRALRWRDGPRLRLDDEQVADDVIEELLARIDGRRTPSRS